MDEPKTEKWTLDDGRRAERRVLEQEKNGEIERVVELHVEDERPLRLQQRVIEKSKPVVYERKIETLNVQTGEVIDQKVESIEPQIKMQLVEHISSAKESEPVLSEKEQLIQAFIAALEANNSVQSQRAFVPEVSSNKLNGEFAEKLQSLGIADEIGKKEDKVGIFEMILISAIGVGVVAVTYIWIM